MSPHPIPLPYPPTRQLQHQDDYHGTIVDDPYRWLEDLDAPETEDFVRAQNEVTFSYLEQIDERDAIHERMTQLWDYEKFSQPSLVGGRYFWLHNDGLQNQAVLLSALALDAEPDVVLDPNAWSADGTVALGGFAIDHQARFLTYVVQAAGSDWMEWRVLDLATREVLADHIRWGKFSGAAWLDDASGFFYAGYGGPTDEFEGANRNHTLFLHRLGTDQAQDEVVYARPDRPDLLMSASVTEGGRWLLIAVSHGSSTNNGLLVKDLTQPGAPLREITMSFDASYEPFDIDGSTLFARTTLRAPRRRVIAIDLDDPSPDNWREVIAEQPETLLGIAACGGRWFAHHLADASSRVHVYLTDGTLERELALPAIGTVAGFSGFRADTETFYTFTSFTEASSIYRYEIATGDTSLFKRAQVAFDPNDFETTQVFAPSKDGTPVPIFLVHKRGLALDGTNPTYLYGYGGFLIPMVPAFNPAIIAWLEMGGVFAQACLRGGSEYGEDWHEAGTKERKQNVFDDFIAAAEWLISRGYTSTPHLAIGGGSNGGLLVGACITQRPDLFGAARIAVGVLDMLRFHHFTIGWAWVSDYGSADEADGFKYLYAYSPLHNIKPGTPYPATLITTGDHDDRVVPSHSFKFAATLQRAQGGSAPVLLRVGVRAGHGAGKPTTKLIEEAADAWSFLAHHTGARL